MNGQISSSLFDKGRLHGFAAVAVTMCMLLSALTALVAITPSADAAEEPFYSYRVGTMASVDTFNPFSMTSGTSWSVAHMMYEFLYAVSRNMTECPQLAVSYEMSPDGLVWTYYLAEDSYFHDGVQVTAHDVAFTFNMILDGGKQTALYKGYVEGIVSVVATGDYTVQITLEEPKATMLGLIVPILPEHIWSVIEADGVIKTVDMFDTDYFPNGPVGSGPLVLNEYSMTSGFVRLLAHEQYHQHEGLDTDRINVDEVMLVIYNNENTMNSHLMSGEIDVIDGVPPLVWDVVLGYDDVEGQTPTAHILEEFGFNCASQEWRESINEVTSQPNFPEASTNYETCNLSVRQAMTMATDVPYIAEEIHQGLAVAADSLIPTATPFWHYDVPEEEYYHFDIEAANELLNNSGYNQFDGTDFGFAGVRENESSGARLEFEFYIIRSIDIDELTAQQMQTWWEQIGVKVNINQVSEGVLMGIWFNMGYDLFIWSWWPDVDPTFLLSVLTTGEIPETSSDTSAWSDAFYSNPEYDQMYLDQQKLMDRDERQAMVHEMQRIAYRDCPYIDLVYPASLIAYRTDKYENIPDMELEANSGVSPSSFWYYFDITPIEGVPINEPPYNVNAGYDVAIYVGDIQGFSGSAEDLESPQEDLNWTWVIDEDGAETTLYGQIVSYTFDIVGTHVVTLTVEDPEGASSSDSLSVTVEEIPVANAGPDIGAVAPDPLTGYAGEEVSWTAEARDAEQGDDGAGLLFTWSWDDGSPDTVDLKQPVENDTFVVSEQTHTWSEVGSYTVSISVWDGYGEETDTSHNVTVSYEYEVSANSAPDGPYVSSINGIEGVEVPCTAMAVDPDPDVLVFTWDWDDGTYTVTTHDTSSAPGVPVMSEVGHTWSADGTYTVTVYVDDGEGHNMSAEVDAVIVPAGGESPPGSISLAVAPEPSYVDDELTLNISAYDANGDALIVTVEFGDGDDASETTDGGTEIQYAEFVHTYATEDTFTVTVYVDDGTTNVTSTFDLDVIANSPPVVSLQSTYTFSLGVEKEIRPSSAMDPDGDDFNVWYDWGDDTPLTPGNAADGFAASHAYDSVGTYTLTVWADDGTDNVSVGATVVVQGGGLGWITGYVKDSAGEPIEGALVSISGTTVSHEYADEGGLYSISALPGTYVVNASATGYSNGTASVIVEEDFGSWSNFTLGVISGSVTGQVLDSATEEPVADALVELYKPGEESASYPKKTDVNGSFEILLVDEGTYEIVVSRTGFETNDTAEVTVTAGEDADLVIYLTADKEVGLSFIETIAIAALAIIAAVAAVALILKRKKGSEPELGLPEEDEPAPEQAEEPPEPPEA